MCGIVFQKDFRGNDVTQTVKRRYKAQRSRGTQGFGYYLPGTNRLTHNPNERKLITDLLAHPSSEVLFHHRFPTSTENVQNACHPFSTKGDLFKHNYVLVHNGYLSNEFKLQDAHEDLGIRYVSEQADGRFNDSEALLYDVALYLEGMQSGLKAEGAIAFVVIERDETGEAIKLHWGRNSGSPLKFKLKRDKYLSLASEGKGSDVAIDTLFTYDYATGVISSTALEIPSYTYSYTPSDYDYTSDVYRHLSPQRHLLPSGESKTLADMTAEDYASYLDTKRETSMIKAIDSLSSVSEDDGFGYYSSTSGRVLPAGSVAAYVDDVMDRNDEIVDSAFEEVETSLADWETEYIMLKEQIQLLDEEDERINEFLGVANRMDELADNIKIGQNALLCLAERLESLQGVL